MDERHWWIAQRAAQAFSIEASSGYLEKFICETSNFEKISNFLCMNGNNKLFFLSTKLESGTFGEITIYENLLRIPKQYLENLENTVILYFIRHDSIQEVSPTQIHKEVYCGEIKKVSHILHNVYSDLLLTMVETSNNWGSCNETSKAQILRNMEKYINSINEVSFDSQSQKNMMLKRVDTEALLELKQPRLNPDSPVIKYCEDLALEWMTTIENILSDICDERFIHQSVGPNSELERWQRKQRLLSSLTEQLKTKECKSVISALIAAKSKILKKWKIIDAGITDAQNECRDKVKFLESLKRPIDQFYQEATPITCVTTALPGLCTAMRTVESVSRYYARQGYLGLLFTKVTNQLVNICKEYLLEAAQTVNNNQFFWPTIFKEIEEYHDLQKILETNDFSHIQKLKSTDSAEFSKFSDSLFQRLKSCLIVQAKYKEAFRNLRDSLGGNLALSGFPSVSSVQTAEQNSGSLREHSVISKKTSSNRKTAIESGRAAGILMSEEDVIFGHLDMFCQRIRCLIDQMVSLSQFQLLFKSSSNLSRPKREDLRLTDERGMQYDSESDEDFDEEFEIREKSEVVLKDLDLGDYSSKPSLAVLIEENEETKRKKSSVKKISEKIEFKSEGNLSTSDLGSDEYLQEDYKDDTRSESPTKSLLGTTERLFNTEKNVEAESKRILKKAQTLSKEDIKLMKKYYSRKNEGPTVSHLIEDHIKLMKNSMKEVKSSHILDVGTKDSNVFQESYQTFLNAQSSLEKFLAAYLNVIFCKTKKTHDGLNVLTTFLPVSQRNILRPIINDKYVEIFSIYQTDLSETEDNFDYYRNNPPILRNAPPIGGAISWVRQMLKKIDEPMKVFKENKYINSLSDFWLTLKQYNSLTFAMINFENDYLSAWKTTIDEAKNGLKDFLMRKKDEDYIFEINADEKLLILFQESKWLLRLGIDIPNSARELLAQEKKFKQYKSNLDMLLRSYREVLKKIPYHLLDLFEPHIIQTLDLCNPGCFILTWNSLNIDSFLKIVENGIKKLDNLVCLVRDSKEATILNSIEKISQMYLFDHELAFSTAWNPEDFLSEIGASIDNIGQQIKNHFAMIEEKIEEIGSVLIASLKNSANLKKKSKITLKEMLNSEPKLTFLKDFYSEKLYNAMHNSILKSLQFLAQACGYESTNNLVNINPDGADALYYMRLKSGDDLTRNNNSQKRPLSVSSVLRDTDWSDSHKLEKAFLKLKFVLKFAIPDVITDPSLDLLQTIVKAIASKIVETSKSIYWIHPKQDKLYYDCLNKDVDIKNTLGIFDSLLSEIGPSIKNHMIHIRLFEFLWKEDLNGLFNDFMKNEPDELVIKREVDRLAKIEKQVFEIPQYLNIGPACLNTESIKVSLKTFSYSWKFKYASVLHEMARTRLQECIVYRENVQKRLMVNVQTLEQLNDALRLLEELSDMENKIDKIYLPIENIYADLQRYELILTRQEIEQVSSLRDNWSQLMNNAEIVRSTLLQDKRNTLEQELDKQVKTFVVEVIRFRNSFDATGPSVVGIDPYEALRRLHEFQKQYDTFDARRKTLDSISILFGLQCKPFPELDKTGEELNLLNQLYKVYQVFLSFDKQLRNTLWSDVDLNKAFSNIKAYWEEFLALPEKLKENWEAYFDLKKALKKYIDVLPILILLNEKEIRNRHWLQVMQVTKSAFRLEAAVFKLNDLIDIGLDLHSYEIEEICKSAKKEQELESKMRTIEEEWNEQVLSFTNYKDYGEICFDKEYTERLLEQLEDAQEILANMLTSKYVGPLRSEVASWSEKLKTIAEVLELWLEVQELWINLESVFSTPATVKEMPAEAKRFLRVDKSWIRSQKQSYDMKSVLQCCLGSSVQENTKRVLLKDIQKELEICFKSLNAYLDKKRRLFPRYYFLSNPSLLALLNHFSNSGNISEVKSYFSSLFSALRDLKLDELRDRDDILSVSSASLSEKPKSGAAFQSGSESPSYYRGTAKENGLQLSELEISEIYSADGEVLVLARKVNLEKGTELWLPKLKESIGETIKKYMSVSLMDLLNNMPIEELTLKYPAQICLIGLNYVWSKEVETSILELKNERKAMSMASKKFSAITNRFLSMLSKSRWPNIDKPVLVHHKLRLETMVTHSNYLRDLFDNIANKKIKDLNDFEWQRCFRVYVLDENASSVNPKFCFLDDNFSYGNEFYGIEQQSVITPLTERCFLTILQASRIMKGSIVCGKPNSGKTQISKGLAQYMGKFMYILYCSGQTDHSSIANCLQGVAQEGSWVLFDELQNLSELCLSWFNEYSSGIYQALRKRSSLVQLSDGKEMSVNPNFCLISTLNASKHSGQVPLQLRSMFRVIALLEPDIEVIIKAKCIQYGVKGSNILATRLKTIYDLCQASLMSLQSKYQLTISTFLCVIRIMYEKQNMESGDSRPGSLAGAQSANKYSAAKLEMLSNQTSSIKELPRKNRLALANYSKSEHAQIGQMLIDNITPRLDSNDSKTFKKIVQEILMFKEDSKIAQSSHAANLTILEKIITEKSSNDYGFFPNKNWIDKCLQIYTVSNTFEGIILCGQPCTGKTSTLNVLVDALTELGERDLSASQNNFVFKQKINSHHAHKIRKINHLAIDDESLLFGSLSQNNEFKDGFLTYALRKACRNESTTWLCLDGQILPNWCDSFNSIFDSGLFMQLKNGDHLRNNCKIVFETGDISNASPSLLSKTGIICYGEDLVGWRSIARSWLESRIQNEVQQNSSLNVAQCLQRCFSKTMDEISNYCLKECKPMLPVCEESLFISCLNLLAAMLNENTNIGGEVHIERLYLYCLIWTFGGVLEQNDQRGFSELLYRLVTALPDDDLKSSVFEYYVDESGEWDLWSQRVPENVYMDNMDLLGNVYVDTIESIRCRIFLEFCNLAHKNVILFGPRGCGKSKLLQEFIQEFDSNVTIVKRLNFSGATNVNQLQKFVESNIVHRQGFTFGAPDKKKLSIFIDDIDVPVTDKNGIQRCNEFIRQIVDSKLIYSFSKPFEVKKLEDISFYATMTYESRKARSIDSRLLRHSILLYLPVPSGTALRSIFNGTLEASMLFNEKSSLDSDLHAALIDSSVKLLELVSEVFKPCPTPGRQHYLFNMKTIITILQNLRMLSDTQRTDNLFIISLWRHEVFSTIGNQLPRHADSYWLECTLNDLIKQKFSSYTNSQDLLDNFVNFRIENRNFDRPMSSFNNRSSKTNLSTFESLGKVRSYLEQVYNRYKEEFGYYQINIFLSENAAYHIIRIYRILTFTQGGNLLLIGNIGNHLTSLVKLAFYLADIHLSTVDCSKSSLFYDSMRAAVRTAGSENKYVGIIFSSKDLFRTEYLDTINSLLNNGECNDLFSNDEMDGLYHAIGPSIKREYPNIIIDPKKFFNTRVRRNLHICLSLQPNGDTFKLILKNYVQIISSCQIYWIKDWTEEALLNEARSFMRDRLESEELREKVARCMSEIHSFMLNECRQIPWTGSNEKDIKLPQSPPVKTPTDKKISKTNSTSSMVTSIPNWPYSKTILEELIKNKHMETNAKSKLHFFIGPNTYLKFMNSFWYFFTTKAKQCENDIIRLRKVLDTLSKTREGAKQMKAYIKDLKIRCKQAEIDSEESLKILIDKTTAVEKLKAKLGLGGSLATLMQMQKDIDISADNSLIDDKLLNNNEVDEFDVEFNRMRDESEKSKMAKMNEDLEKAKHQVEECKKALVEKKRQVDVWKNRVDRSCIERIRAFQNPPAMIGQIMEMIMILIGKKKLPESAFFFKAEQSTSQLANNPPKEKDKKAGSVLDTNKGKQKAQLKTDRIDRSHWKQYQNIMTDSPKFCELLHTIEWEDGLSMDVSTAVESYLAKGKDGQLGLTGEGSLLDNAKDVNIAASKSSDANHSKGITISGARYASEDAATLVNYVIAILEYSRLCIPLKTAKDKVEAIKYEQAEFERKKMERENETLRLKKLEESLNIESNAKPEESLSEDDLPRLVKELEELQAKFDASAVNKHKLHIELESCIQRMEAATSIIESPSHYELEMNPNMVCLTNLEDQWKKWIEEHLSHEQTITNCLITAAYICYCGPFDRDTRERLGRFFSECCFKHAIPREPQQVFKNFTLPEFLFTPIQLKEIQLLRLPVTENILENGCFLIEDKSYDSWPLICDSSRRSINWLKTFYSDKQFYVIKEFEMKSVLETCLSEGHFLLLTDCDVANLMNNRKIETVLRNKNRFLTSDKPFKLNLGNQEIECNPKFRIFLHTGNDTTEIPDHLAAYTLVLNFRLVRIDLEEELLDRFLQLAKPRIDSERYGLLQEKVNTLKIIDPLEQDITNFLASEVDLLNSVEPTKRLSDLKKSYDEAVDSNMRIEIAEEPLTKTRESYREIALRGAICFDVISCLKEINSNYILSFKQFVEIFDDSLFQFERSSTPQVINKLTSRVFTCLSRLMSESDRKVFAILLCMEIEASVGRLRVGEREFLISPVYGAMVMQAITNKQMTDHKHWQAKKPFDWMSEDQFLNLQYLAVSQPWFNEPFERMGRDGWETQWRSLCESETPETVSLPEKLDDILSPIQRFCIVRAVRGDRILQISLAFVASVLGKSYVSSNTIDFDSIFSESTCQKPIVLMYQEESETIRRYFSIYAKTKIGSNYSIIDINSLGSGADKQIKRMLLKPMEEGNWVLLLNCHNSAKILHQIESILVDSNHKNLDANFRCWISLLQSDNQPPTSLMLNSVRAFIGPALTVKENIVRSFSWVDSEQIKISSRPEWSILLHNLCYFHSCLKLRNRYTRCGWNSPYTLNFTTEEFLESLKIAGQDYFQNDAPSRGDSIKSVSDSVRSTSLQILKYTIADLIYGSSASNEYDLQAIECIADYWIASISNRKDFELSKLKYKIPSQFTSQPVKLSSLQQALENIPPLQLEAPEACHLLPSIETVLGDDVFIMTRLSKLIDCLLTSPTMVKAFNRPLTPIDNSVVPQINSNSTNPIVYQFNTFSTSSFMASQNKKYNDLNEYCNMILTTKIPKTYSKEYINEKVKKNAGWSTYNYWIVNEMNLISNLINTIKSHAQIIKNATENRKLGWEISSEVLEVADSLYYNQIPKLWCILSGSESHFSHYPLGSFLNDLSVRFQHIDKCLTIGREKNPAFNLGAFYYPQNLLSIFKFETLKTKNQAEDFGCVESLVFQTEMTSRDKEHLRDPPKEGMFVYGLYLWGCHWEKSTSELVDQPIKLKEGNMPLPVIHLTCWLESEKPLFNDTSKSQDLYKCPVFPNRNERDQSVFDIDLIHAGIPAIKWAMRGVCATLKPY